MPITRWCSGCEPRPKIPIKPTHSILKYLLNPLLLLGGAVAASPGPSLSLGWVDLPECGIWRSSGGKKRQLCITYSIIYSITYSITLLHTVYTYYIHYIQYKHPAIDVYTTHTLQTYNIHNIHTYITYTLQPPPMCMHFTAQVLQWMRAQDPPCPWDAWTCDVAVACDNLNTLQWLRAQVSNRVWHRRIALKDSNRVGE
jgi:hypothetical protein